MLRIYGYAGSINVRKVLWTCDELGLPYDREDWAGGTRSVSEPAFAALNPVGMVPVIDDGDTRLWESNTIIRYLAARHGRTDLLPADPAARAQVEKWMDWQGSDFNNSWRVCFQALVRKNPAVQDPVAIEASLSTFAYMVGIIDAQLAASKGYLCGDTLTLADVVIGLSIHRWYSIPADKPAYTHIQRYYDKLCERPGFQVHGRDAGP